MRRVGTTPDHLGIRKNPFFMFSHRSTHVVTILSLQRSAPIECRFLVFIRRRENNSSLNSFWFFVFLKTSLENVGLEFGVNNLMFFVLLRYLVFSDIWRSDLNSKILFSKIPKIPKILRGEAFMRIRKFNSPLHKK